MKENAVYRRLLGYLKPYRRQLFLAYFSMVFATLLNLFVPQIIKDAIDLPGDKLSSYHTLPVLLSTRFRERVILVLAILIAVLILIWLLVAFPYIHPVWMWILGLFLMFIPQCLICYKLYKNDGNENLGIISKSLKLNMLIGILYLILI